MAKDKEVLLPRVYTEEVWKRNGSNEVNKKWIGTPYMSWSQVESFRDEKGFNTGLEGSLEYIKGYFYGEKFPDMGWGQHGTEVEAYICYNDYSPENFDKLSSEDKIAFQGAVDRITDEGLRTLESITPLGDFQREVIYKVPGFSVVILGFIDDMTPPKGKIVEMVRDYKTKSEKSKKDLHLLSKFQLEIYSEALRQIGYEVKNAEYVIIERSMEKDFFQVGGGVEKLGVLPRVWREEYPRINDPQRIVELNKILTDTITKVSGLYTIYQKFYGE